MARNLETTCNLKTTFLPGSINRGSIPVCWLATFFILNVPFLTGQSANAQNRTWTDSTGKFRVEATFVALKDGKVQLKKASTGTVITLPISRLSEADQQLIKQLVTKPKNAKSRPPIELSAELRWSDLFDLDQNNKPIPKYLELQVTATGSDAKQALEFGHLQLTELTDQDGTELDLRKAASDFFDLSNKFIKIKERGTGFFAKHPEQGVRCVFEIVRPETNLTGIKSAKGSFKLKTGGNRENVKIEKAIANLGKVSSNVLDKLGLQATISRPKADVLEVQVKGSNPAVIFQVHVLDPEREKLLDLNGFSERGMNLDRTFSYSFKRAVPANATVFISIAQDTIELEVPFSFSDLKLPERK